MPDLKYNNEIFEALESETVLDCLIRHGQKISHSCKSGICQSCLLKTTSQVDSNSQKGLSAAKKESGIFLSCQQRINKDLEIFDANDSSEKFQGQILSQDRVTNTVVLISIQLTSPLDYRAGQFVNIIREDGLSRSYSLAGTNNNILKLHVKKTPNGTMSSWLYDENLIGTNVLISGPIGECYLDDTMFEDELLLLGVGTGLAPLFGILKDAFIKGFKNPIRLYHGGFNYESLYLVEELKNLEEKHENFSYFPAVFKGDEKKGFLQGDLIQIIKDLKIDAPKTTSIVCGDPEMVKKIKQTIFLKGVSSKKILSDSFISAANK